MNLAEIELEAGKTGPFPEGFDPLGLSKDKSFKELKKWREAELKHGTLLHATLRPTLPPSLLFLYPSHRFFFSFS